MTACAFSNKKLKILLYLKKLLLAHISYEKHTLPSTAIDEISRQGSIKICNHLIVTIIKQKKKNLSTLKNTIYTFVCVKLKVKAGIEPGV